MATIKDVAMEAGLAVGTVSRVLNNRGYISDEARKKVQEAMERLNYQPNEMARSLQKKHSDMIGVIVPLIDHPYFAKLISCLEEAAYERGNRLLLLNSKGTINRESEYLDLCRRNKVEGIILCNGNLDIRENGDLDVPVVTIERKMEGGDAAIECNNYEGGVLAAERLIGAGCRNLLHIKGTISANMPADRRWDGFRETCDLRGVSCKMIEAPLEDYRLDQPEDYFRFHWKDISQSDGIFVSDDLLAMKLIHFTRRRGRKIPGDLKVIGFDDVEYASYLMPTLTTIRQPLKEMAEAAIDLVKLLNQGKAVPKCTVFPVELVPRETC